MLKKSKFNKLISSSIMALMMAGTINSGIIGMRQMYVHAATIKVDAQKNLKTPISKKVIEETIVRTAKVVLNTHYSMDWTVIGLNKAGAKIPLSYLENVTKHLEDKKNEVLLPTEYARMTLGILAAGGDPTNVGESNINLIEKIYTADLQKQGINALVFALIALDAKGEDGYTIPYKDNLDDGIWTRNKIIEAILQQQNKEGGWSFFGGDSDPDMTGMVMTALSKYNITEYKDVQIAIEKAVNRLSEIQLKNGGFESWGTENSESCAQVIMGLSTNGIDPDKDPRFVKGNKSVVDVLLSFEVKSTGQFMHVTGTRGDGMATEQALYALDQYKLFLDEWDKADKGKKNKIRPTIYKW